MRRAAALVAVAATLAWGSVSCAGDDGGSEVTVLAAASLTEAFDALAPLADDRGLDLLVSFAGTPTLVEQFREGAPADVIVAADVDALRPLVEAGLITTPVPVARNHLVVVVPAAHDTPVDTVDDLALPGVRVVLAAAEVPAGRHARRGLAELGLLDGVAPNVVSAGSDVKAVAAMVALGEADAGIVYVTDADADDRLRVVGRPLPVDTVYAAAVATDAPHPDAARRFVELLSGPAGRKVLAHAGFELPVR